MWRQRLNRITSIVSAAALGIVIMLLPILAVTPTTQPTFQSDQPQVPSAEEEGVRGLIDLSEEVRAAETLGKSDVGAVAFPSSFIYAGLVVVLGLIVAFGTSLYAKRRVSLPIERLLA